MSDRPSSTSNNPPEKRDSSEFWHQPETPGGWRVPSGDESGAWRTPGEAEASGAWRVPALPADLDIIPDDKGTWHLPRPEDTTFREDDELEVSAAAASAPPGTIPTLPFDDLPAIEPQREALAQVDDGPPQDVPLPFEPALGRAPDSVDDNLTPDLVYGDDDEDDTFSMSELVALASLVDEQPQAKESGELAPEGVAAPQANGKQENAPAKATDERDADTPIEGDPAEYARRQLEKLGERQPPPVVTEPEVPEQPADDGEKALSPLAKKYRVTEENVRKLRQQYHANKISREQLQAELRKHMVLDENNVWWMLGVETDTWYKYDNGQWVAATPPALAAADASPRGVTEPAEVLPGDHTVPTGAVGNLSPDDDYMPLPRVVPVRDPDFTLPGTGGVYLPPVPGDLNVTQPVGSTPGDQTMPGAAVSGATVPNAPVDVEQAFAGVPSPVGARGAAESPPSYDIPDRPSRLYSQVAQRRRQSLGRTLLIVGVIAVALLFLMGACAMVGGIAYYSSLAAPYQDEIAALANYQPQFQTARILDAEGNLIVELTSRDGGARENIALRDMSPYFIHAVVATENERFFDDAGWDPIAIGRAFLQNVVSGDIESGASTITQQIARNLILHDYTLSAERKLQEIVIASEIAQRYDKNFILELYLNEVFFGNRSYGVEAASEFYFDKPASDLNIAESALLAGLIQSPATYDPLVNREAALDRMVTVLQRMRRVGCLQFQHEPYLGEPFCITDQQIRLNNAGEMIGGSALVDRANVELWEYEPRQYTLQYPHFVNFVQAEIENTFGTDEMYRRGFTIHTTLRPQVQNAAQTALTQQIAAAAGTGLNTGAVLVTDPVSGAIYAMVGSPDFNNEDIDGQVNNVFTWQQPGSSIKPIVYTAALEGTQRNGRFDYLTPASVVWDVPTTYNTNPPYAPTNYDRQFHGPVALRYALQNSYNVPAVKVLEFVGLDKFRDVATRMGLQFMPDAQLGLPSALGSNEVRLYDHVQAYGTLANGGRLVPLFAITAITDASGNEIPLPPRPEPVQSIAPQVAFLMQNILADNQARAEEFGLNSGLTIPGYDGLVAAKTGTTNGSRDLWTMGFTTNAVVGVWTGTVDNSETNATTSTAAIPIWNSVMRAVLEGNAPQPFPDPGGVVAVQVCADTGAVYDPNQQCSSPRTELFLQNQPPPPPQQAFVQRAAVDTWTGLRANQFCTENIETRTFVSISDPTAVQWLASAEGQTFAQSLGLPADVQPLPSGECAANTQLPNIHINAPGDGQQVQGEVQVVGSVAAPNFNRYQLEVASVNNPDQWLIVHGPVTNQQQPGSVIGTWDTRQVPNGIYTLRLAAFANDGGYVYRTVRVGVNNVEPTPVPLPTQVPPQNPAPDAGFTPLPFEISVVTATPPPGSPT